MERFVDLFEDCTSQGTKIKTDEYHENGKYVIIDQGQNDIAGYTDEMDGVYEDVPAIIFGDHTRVIKYVNRPFFLGADGVKLLKCKRENANYKYLYYALKNAKIPDTGYNRHYKWLKEIKIAYPDSAQQQKIVDVLDKVEMIIIDRRNQLSELDRLIKSRFVEMFGNMETNPKNYRTLSWQEVFLTTTGKLDSNAMVEGGEYPFFTCAKEYFWIDQYAFDCEALLLAGNNAAGIYDVKHYKGKFNAYQRTYVLQLQDKSWSYPLFKQQLEDRLFYLKGQSKGTNTRYLTLGILNKLYFIIPPVELQDEFTAFVQAVDRLRVIIQKSLDANQLLCDNLMQKYFG